MVELPISPDFNLFFITGILPIFVGAFISWRLTDANYDHANEENNYADKYTSFQVFLPIIIGAIIVVTSMAYFTFESQEYKSEMLQIIETTDCSELISIAHEVSSYYRGLVVDEVVVRCLSEQDKSDPVLMLLLSEVRG